MIIQHAMYLSLIKIYPARGWEQRVLDVLDSIKGPITSHTDCLGCLVTIESGEMGAICYIEQWLTSEALEKHMRSTLYGRLLEAIEHSGQSPEVVFYEVNKAQGFELVEKVRASLLNHKKQAGEYLAERSRKSDDIPENFPDGQR